MSKWSAYAKARRIRYALAGLCSDCQAPALPTGIYCDKHRRRNLERLAKRRRLRGVPRVRYTRHCSRCKRAEHDVRTCPEPRR